MKATTSDADIAAFLARGGQVTKVETGVRAIASDRRIYCAFRDGRTIAADAVEVARKEKERVMDAENAAERYHETYIGARFSGASSDDAFDEACAVSKLAYRKRGG